MATEKRLIDANEIKYTEYRSGGGRDYPENIVTEDEIARMPTVDAVEVLRCKDCKHWNGHPYIGELSLGLCVKLTYIMVSAGFCSLGERRSDHGKS